MADENDQIRKNVHEIVFSRDLTKPRAKMIAHATLIVMGVDVSSSVTVVMPTKTLNLAPHCLPPKRPQNNERVCVDVT